METEMTNKSGCTENDDPDLENSCWICFQTGSAAEPLQRPCRCPTLCHAKCLALWQLHCAGKLEEGRCRFCHNEYPDWRPVLTPDDVKSQTPIPVLSIYYAGQCTRIKVRPGPEGLQMFTTQLRQILQRDVSTVNLVFRCRCPETGAELYLHGIQAWSAAIHCACVRAARRMAGVHKSTRRIAEAAQQQGAEQPAHPARPTPHERSLETRSAPPTLPASPSAYWPQQRSNGHGYQHTRVPAVLPMPHATSAPTQEGPAVMAVQNSVHHGQEMLQPMLESGMPAHMPQALHSTGAERSDGGMEEREMGEEFMHTLGMALGVAPGANAHPNVMLTDSASLSSSAALNAGDLSSSMAHCQVLCAGSGSSGMCAPPLTSSAAAASAPPPPSQAQAGSGCVRCEDTAAASGPEQGGECTRPSQKPCRPLSVDRLMRQVRAFIRALPQLQGQRGGV